MGSQICIEPATAADIPTLAFIFDIATSADAFHEVMKRYGPRSPYEDGMESMSDGMTNPNQHIFKAVERSMDTTGTVIGEKVVGMAQWSVGFIEIPKADPFAKESQDDSEAVMSHVTGSVATAPKESAPKGRCDEKPAPQFDFYDQLRRPGMNTYIRCIRGKRHVFLRRIGVLPEFQHRGIATQLLQWVTEMADNDRLVAWLNARPAAISLYEKGGWRQVGETPVNAPGLVCAPVVQMLRQPMPR